MRIYELLKQWCETRTEIPYTVDSLKELLGIEDNASSINSLNYKLFSSILKNKIDDLEKRKRIEAEQEEESRYWLLLSEDERDDACRLNISCKTYYEIIKSPENSTDEELLPNF